MNTNPLFSVLIANYNNGTYLQEAIDSVYAQTYTNWEIILVDDASTDNSKELYEKMSKDSRIHIFFNEANRGCGYTKRRCAELANGELCGFLDPDDMLTNEALEYMVNTHLLDESLSMAYSSLALIDSQKNVISVPKWQHQIPSDSSYLYCKCGVIAHFVSFKSEAYKKTEGIGAEFFRANDQDLYLKLEEVGRIKYIDKVMYHYRIDNPNSISIGDNIDKAFLFNIVARANACKRRDLSIETVLFPHFNEHIQLLKQKYERELAEIKNSRSYKIGRLLTAPYRFFRDRIKAKLFTIG